MKKTNFAKNLIDCSRIRITILTWLLFSSKVFKAWLLKKTSDDLDSLVMESRLGYVVLSRQIHPFFVRGKRV